MKRYSLIVAALLLLIAMVASAAISCQTMLSGSFPNFKPGLYPTLGNDDITIDLQQGWFGYQLTPQAPVNNVAAWYFCTDTNNPTYATEQGLRFTPRLTSALDNGARKMYVVLNYNNLGPVFETAPIGYNVTPFTPTYSGLWEVVFVYWNPGSTPHIIKNALPESPTNPYGLPTTGITLSWSPIIQIINGVPTPVDASGNPAPLNIPRIVVDCPIVALGTLAHPTGNPQFGGLYRIPQIIDLDSRYKTITLPTWFVYCRNNITQKIEIEEVVITDVQNPNLVQVVKANYAPGLAAVPLSDTQHFWIVNWLQPYYNPAYPNATGVFVVPPKQFAVTEECPNDFPGSSIPSVWQNTNTAYTPIYEEMLLNRVFLPQFPGFTDKTVITSEEFINTLLGNGLVTEICSGTKLNAPNVGIFYDMKPSKP